MLVGMLATWLGREFESDYPLARDEFAEAGGAYNVVGGWGWI